jgi:hypothetical protein
MVETVTIVIAYISCERGQSLLNVDQCFSLEAGADNLQGIDEPRHLVVLVPVPWRFNLG